MPQIKSAKKALRQNLKKRIANKKRKDSLKYLIKDFKKICLQKNKKGAKEFLAKCYKILDKSAKTNIIHKNKARRLKSKLSKLHNII